MLGMRMFLPVAISIAAYGLVWGVLAGQAGLSVLEVALMSSIVFAGASQFIALEMWATGQLPILSIVIAIQQQSGGNLSEALSNLSGVLRDRVRLQMKVKALSAEAKASALVLAALPPTVMFLLFLTSPGYIKPLFDTRVGNFALLACGIWMMMGVLVMRRMINFKF
mgnify:CR=1 FL=1